MRSLLLICFLVLALPARAQPTFALWVDQGGTLINDYDVPFSTNFDVVVTLDSDGHDLSIPGMREAVLQTVQEPKEGIDYAITQFAIEQTGKQISRYSAPGLGWTDGDILQRAVEAGDMSEFTAFLREHASTMCWVAPQHFMMLPEDLCGALHLVTHKNCWKQTDDVVADLTKLEKHFDVVLFAASFLTCCAIYRLHELYQGKWLLDVGSAMDPLCGVLSRKYQRGGKRDWKRVYGL